MKRIIALFTLIAVVASATPVSMTVTTTSVKVLPGKPVLSGVTWTNGITVAQGQVLRYQGQSYMAETAGVKSTEPVPGTTTDGLRWTTSRDRAIATIQNLGTTEVFLSFRGPAESGKGLKLVADAVMSLEDVQTAVHAITASGSTTLGITEVSK